MNFQLLKSMLDSVLAIILLHYHILMIPSSSQPLDTMISRKLSTFNLHASLSACHLVIFLLLSLKASISFISIVCRNAHHSLQCGTRTLFKPKCLKVLLKSHSNLATSASLIFRSHSTLWNRNKGSSALCRNFYIILIGFVDFSTSIPLSFAEKHDQV